MWDGLDVLNGTREYQEEAIKILVERTQKALAGVVSEEKYPNRGKLNKAGLLHMATGTGKTWVMGNTLNNTIPEMIKQKGRPLKIIVVSHRMDITDKLAKELKEGSSENNTPPLLSEDIIQKSQFHTLHSKSKKRGVIPSSKKSQFYCCVVDTASDLKTVESLSEDADIVIIDEAHNVSDKSLKYSRLIEKVQKQSADAIYFALTATPNNQTIDMFGQALFEFGLVKYLLSEFSPKLLYTLIANTTVSEEEVLALYDELKKYNQIEDIKLKKKYRRKIKKKFDDILSKSPSHEDIIDDFLTRASKNGSVDETVVFCNSIEEADILSNIFNKKLGEGSALSYHSKNDRNRALEKIEDPNNPCKVIIAVGKLNEGIDIPKVRNFVFCRLTDSETVFIQQFGRGLRGSHTVHYYDYVGLVKNFARIYEIFKEYMERFTDSQKRNPNKKRKPKFNLLGTGSDLNGLPINIESIGAGKLSTEAKKESDEILMPDEAKQFFIEKGLDYWVDFGQKEISDIVYKGRKIVILAQIAGYEIPENLQLHVPYGFRKFLSWLFDIELDSLESIKKHFFNIVPGDKRKSFIKAFLYTQKQVKGIRFDGLRIQKIVTNSGREGLKSVDVRTPGGFQDRLIRLFDIGDFSHLKGPLLKVKDDPEDNLEYWMNIEASQFESHKLNLIRNYFYNQEDSVDRSFEYFMKLTKSEIYDLVFLGQKIYALVNLSGWSNPNKQTLTTPIGFQSWICRLFNRPENELSEENIRNYFFDIKSSKKDSFNYRYSLGVEEINKIQIRGNFIQKIVSRTSRNYSGIKNTQLQGNFRERLEWLFDIKAETLSQEEIKSYFFNIVPGNKEASFSQLIKYKQSKISQINYKGRNASDMAKICGRDVNNRIIWGIGNFRLFVYRLFGKEAVSIDLDVIKNHLYNTVPGNKEASYRKLKKYGQKEIKEIEINGKKVAELVTISGWKNPSKLNVWYPKGFYPWIDRLFGHSNVSNETFFEFGFKDEILSYRGSPEDSFMYFMSLDLEQINSLEIGGKNMKYLIQRSGRNKELFQNNSSIGLKLNGITEGLKEAEIHIPGEYNIEEIPDPKMVINERSLLGLLSSLETNDGEFFDCNEELTQLGFQTRVCRIFGRKLARGRAGIDMILE